MIVYLLLGSNKGDRLKYLMLAEYFKRSWKNHTKVCSLCNTTLGKTESAELFKSSDRIRNR